MEKEISQAQVARTHHLAPSTVQLWVKQYREKGLAGLAKTAKRSDCKTFQAMPQRDQLR